MRHVKFSLLVGLMYFGVISNVNPEIFVRVYRTQIFDFSVVSFCLVFCYGYVRLQLFVMRKIGMAMQRKLDLTRETRGNI